MSDTIEKKEVDGKGFFYIEEEGERLAELTYTLQDNGIMTLDHTETNPKMTGKGLASKLVHHAVEYAKENGLKIDPLCEYAAKLFERHEEYRKIQVSPE